MKFKIDPKELATTKGKMRVLVLELDGRPVQGAEVFANVVHPVEGRWMITNHTYVTNSAGVAVVELPPKVGVTQIWASKKGNPGYPDLFACWFPQFQTDAKEIPREFTFQPPLTVIGGLVKDEAGKPIRGVTVDVKVTYLGDSLPIDKPGQRRCSMQTATGRRRIQAHRSVPSRMPRGAGSSTTCHRRGSDRT